MPPPAAGTLFATHGGFGTVDTNLYTVDAVTTALTAVGDTSHIFTGLAFDPTDTSVLYGITGNLGSDQKTLFSIDYDTAAVSSIGALGDTVADICFDDAGQMYGWKPASASSPNRLTLIAKATGVCTDRSASGLTSTAGGGVSFLSSVLYAAPKGSAGDLYTIDTTTGAPTDLGPLTGVSGDNVSGMATRSDVLWGIGNASGKVFTVGPETGGNYPLTVVGTLETTDSGWDSLAAMPGTVADTTPPTLVSVTAQAVTLTLTYDEPLLAIPGPDPTEFTVTVNGSGVAVTAAEASGNAVDLTLASIVTPGDAVLVTYTA